jgi:hypothetical protein
MAWDLQRARRDGAGAAQPRVPALRGGARPLRRHRGQLARRRRPDPFFAESETPFFVGRAVAALAADPEVHRKAGQVLFAADLAEEYGFTDIDGRRPAFYRCSTASRPGWRTARPSSTQRALPGRRPLPADPPRAGQADTARRLAAKLGFTELGPGLGPPR